MSHFLIGNNSLNFNQYLISFRGVFEFKQIQFITLIQKTLLLKCYKFNFLLNTKKKFNLQTINYRIYSYLTKNIISLSFFTDNCKNNQLNLSYFFFKNSFGKKIINFFIKKGKKQKAEILLYKTLAQLTKLNKNLNNLILLKKVILILMPFYESRTYTIRGKSSSITLPIYNKKRRLFLIFKQILNFLKTQKMGFVSKLANVLNHTEQKQGTFYVNYTLSLKHTLKEYPKMHFRWK